MPYNPRWLSQPVLPAPRHGDASRVARQGPEVRSALDLLTQSVRFVDLAQQRQARQLAAALEAGATVPQCAAVLGLSTSALTSRLHRVRLAERRTASA